MNNDLNIIKEIMRDALVGSYGLRKSLLQINQDYIQFIEYTLESVNEILIPTGYRLVKVEKK